jgi:RNA polymerase sigma-70 factor, ECF subfamily
VEEGAQETFLRIYTRLADYEGRGSFEGWLTRIATTTCLNLIRGQKRRPEHTLTDLTTDETRWLEDRLSSMAGANQKSVEDRLVAADLAGKVLGTLSPDDRLVLMLIDANGASIQEVSEMTGWSESKVKVRAFRARRRMRLAVERLLAGAGISSQSSLESAGEK